MGMEEIYYEHLALERYEQVKNEPEFKAYNKEFWRRLKIRSRRVNEPAPNSPDSRLNLMQWLSSCGRFWHGKRDEVKIDIADFAERLDIPRSELAFFEFGMVEPEIFSGDLPQRYAQVLGRSDCYIEFCQKFGIQEIVSTLTDM